MVTLLEGSEREIIDACRRGDRDAFRALFEIYKNRVYSIALRYSGNEAAAGDITQGTFLKLFSSIANFRGEASFETWVYRLVVNSCLDHKRRSRRLVPMAEGVLAGLRAPGDSLNRILRAETAAFVRSAVERLSPDLRIAIVLRYTEGLSYDQIAEAMACSPGTVASRLNRAHKALERRLSHLAHSRGGRDA